MSSILAILEAVMNSLWQAAIVAALVWLALRFLPRFKIELNAATRYAIWWAALAVVVILPVAPTVLHSLRTRAPGIAAKAPAAPKLTPLPAPPAEPVIITVTPERTARWPLAIVAVWAGILLFRLGQITHSYFYLRGVKKRADVSSILLPASSRRAELLISRDIPSPMAVGFARPAVILPESLLGELSEPEREHVLLHEMAHLAGYDDWSNLAMRLLGAALALHPVAVWILRRIEREREMVCDDWVVARTSDARPYAATLARLFELRWSRKDEALAPGLLGRGTSVGDRIEMLLRRGRTFSPRASEIDVIASLLVLGLLMLGASLVPRWISFAQDTRPSFEVASVKPGDPARPASVLYRLGGRFTASSATLRMLIGNAYDLRDHQIAGGPDWLNSAQFEVDARAGSSAIPAGPAGVRQMRPMLQSLLAERFKLVFHRETRQEAIYELVIDKGGPKLRDAAVTFPSGIRGGKGEAQGIAATMADLSQVLAQSLGRSVVDKTGLTGKYDFTLKWAPDAGRAVTTDPANPEPAADTERPSIFTAIEQDLGLKLQAARGPVEVFVIDHAAKPTEN